MASYWFLSACTEHVQHAFCPPPSVSAVLWSLECDRTRCDRSSHATRAVRKDTFAAPRRRKIDVIGFRSCSVIHNICWRISIPPELRNLVCCGNYTLTLQCSNLCITHSPHPTPTPIPFSPPPSPEKKKRKKEKRFTLKKRKKSSFVICQCCCEERPSRNEMWLCMMWHGAWLYGVHRTCAETAAVSCGTSHASAVSTPLRWIFKKLVNRAESHASAVSLLKRAENSAI